MAASPKRRIKAASSSLPDEIVEEILARLPAKSLRRFQCVSRSWHGLITSPRFRQLHSSRAHPRGLFVRPAGHTESFHACRQFVPTVPPVVEEILSAAMFAQAEVFPVNYNKSCNGLVLLCCPDYSAYYVWNPSTGHILALPDRTPFRVVGWYKPYPFVSYGLAHCSTTDQYKVVRMYWHRDAMRCEVFTLDQSTYWRPAATEPPSHRLRVWRGQGAVFCNGSLHFVAKDGVITAFNVTDETFATPVPPADPRGFDLTELDGCLCAYFSSQVPTPACPYHIWLLRDYDAAAKGCCGGWKELRCFDWAAMADAERAALRSQWVAPLAMTYPDKKIMFATGSCKVFMVDPSSNSPPVTLFSLELEPTGGAPVQDGHFATMGFIEESLVPVGRTVDEIIWSSPSANAWCQVLSRLPTRMVGRFYQVCKDWRAIIKSDAFVEDHLQYHRQAPPQIMFTDGKPNNFKPLENFINDTSQVPPLIDDDDACSRVVCSKPCHGLNAGAFMSYDFVCNPVTGYYKALPLDDGDGHPMHPFAGRLGLGYDAEIGLHVIVRITFKERNLTTRDYKLECEIRTIGDDTMFWAELDPPSRPIAADTPPAYSSGKIYWMADSKLLGQKSLGYDEIIALDVATCEFEILKGPLLRRRSSEESVSIVELQGQICIVCSHPSLDNMEIWAMKGNGMAWSMEHYIDLRRFTPEYSAELVTPITIDPRDGRILLSTGRALGYYDPRTAEIQTIYCLGKHISKEKKFVPILFQESLVSRPCDKVDY